MQGKIDNVYSEMLRQKLSVQNGIFESVNWFSHFIVVLFLFPALVFSTSAFAVVCTGVKTDFSESIISKYIAEAPNDPSRYYTVGLSYYCGGKRAKGISYMERASDMGDITASYILALYYSSDKTGDVSKMVPEVQENYDAALFYYERAAVLIESTSTYPHGVHVDLPDREKSIYMSVRTYLALTDLYYTGYGRALGDMLKNDVSYTDTIKVLTNLQTAAERCLKRPSLSVWGESQSKIAHSKQVICGAYKDFAVKAFNLESKRIEVAKHCDGPLSECEAHQAVVNQIIGESQELADATHSVPPI